MRTWGADTLLSMMQAIMHWGDCIRHSKRKVEREREREREGDKEPQAREKEKEEDLDRVLSIVGQHMFQEGHVFLTYQTTAVPEDSWEDK